MLLTVVSGIVFLFSIFASRSLETTGVELDTIAAVMIGGTLLTGGYGTMFGIFVGMLFQGLTRTCVAFQRGLDAVPTRNSLALRT